MKIVLFAISLYLTLYTFTYAKIIWKKEKKKLASIIITLFALTFLPLTIWLSFFKG